MTATETAKDVASAGAAVVGALSEGVVSDSNLTTVREVSALLKRAECLCEAMRAKRLTSSCSFGSAELRGSCCRGGNRMKSAGQSPDCRFGIGAQSVPPRKPSRIVVGKPGTSISVLPNQNLQRQIDANRWCQLHEWCSYLGIAEY